MEKTLRDEFAMAALPVIIRINEDTKRSLVCEIAYAFAEAAIDASGAEHLGELVRVLTMLSKRQIATWYVGGNGKGYYAGWDDAEYFIREALAKLPLELRGEL